jgi:membrane protease YdiL (CAAX protease family)
VQPIRHQTSGVAAYIWRAYLFSWVPWTLIVLLYRDVPSPPIWALLLAFAGIYGPSLAAISTVASQGGLSAIRVFLKQSFHCNSRPRWYAIVLFGPPAFVWIGAVIRVCLGSGVRFSGMQSALKSLAVLATFIPFGPLGEELGWRGYLLRRLEALFSPLVSSILIGIIWAAWHAPMFWFSPIGLPTRDLSSVAMWTANIVSFSILLSYAARHTNYSVPIAILLHASLNAGSAMGLATLASSPPDLHAIEVWSHWVRWLTVFAVAVVLARDEDGGGHRQSYREKLSAKNSPPIPR